VKHPIRAKIIAYSITTVLGALACFWVFKIRGYSASMPLQERYRVLCDAFFIPGILLILFGALAWVASQDAFAGLAFVGRNMLRALIPGGRLKYPHETYFDFLEERRAKREARKGQSLGLGFLFFPGLAFLAVSLVFLVLFYQVYEPEAANLQLIVKS